MMTTAVDSSKTGKAAIVEFSFGPESDVPQFQNSSYSS